jgi:hypothetical protein
MQYQKIYYQALQENIKDDLKDQLTAAWYKYFPNSRIAITNSSFGGEDFNIRCVLSGEGGPIDNDPLNFSVWVWDNSKKESFIEPASDTWTVEISRNDILIKSENKYLAFSSKRIPARGAKHISLDKAVQVVIKSFSKVKETFEEIIEQDLMDPSHKEIFESASKSTIREAFKATWQGFNRSELDAICEGLSMLSYKVENGTYGGYSINKIIKKVREKQDKI